MEIKIQKNSDKIQIFKSAFLISFLLATILSLKPIGLAKAAGCTYGVTLNQPDGSNGVTNTTMSQTLSFTAVVTESGDLSCVNSVNVVIQYLKGNNGYVTFNSHSCRYEQRFSNCIFFGNLEPTSYIFSSNPNTAQIQITVYDTSAHLLKSSNTWTVNAATTNSSSNGSISGTETLALVPNQTTYNSGDPLSLNISMDSTMYAGAQAKGISNIYITRLLPNNQRWTTDDKYVPLTSFANNQPVSYGPMTIDSDSQFQNGTNNPITIELWDQASGLKVGSATVNIQVQGLGATPTTCTANSSCSGVGNICSNGSCVATPDSYDFNCSSSNATCPSGMTCVTGDGLCEQPCTSATSCNYNGESCNPQGYCTAGGQASNVTAPAGTSAATQPSSAAGMAGNSATTLYNPLPEEDLTHVFLLVMQGFLAIIGIWAVMFLFIGGFQLVMAAGSEEMYTKAKKTIIWAVLGLVIALLSFSIIAIVQDLFQSNIQPVTSVVPTTTTTTIPSNGSATTVIPSNGSATVIPGN